jgi:hypothetical protein
MGTANASAAPCVTIANDAERLACFDAAYRIPAAPQREVAARRPEAAPAHENEPAVATTTGPEAEFGLSGKEKDKRRGIANATDRIRSRVTEVDYVQPGKPTFRLENGQLWYQTEATDRPAYKIDEIVEIRRASMNSFLASVPDSGRAAVRVRRLE